MSFAPQLSSWLLQAAAVVDTPTVRVVRGETTVFDITSGVLQLIVLVLAVVVLGALAYMLVTLKKALDSLKGTVDKLYTDARPLISTANNVAGDAREVVAMLRTDVERVTTAAGELSEQLLDVAAVTERRMDDINAVIDVVQGEIEETVLSTAATLRGVRVGGRAVAGALSPRRGKSKRALRRAAEDARLYAEQHASIEDDDEEDVAVAETREGPRIRRQSPERLKDRERLERDTAEHERERLARRQERALRDEREKREEREEREKELHDNREDDQRQRDHG